MRMATRIAGIALGAASLAAAATAATASRPDLVVTRASVSKTVVIAGGSFRAYETTANRGAAAAGLAVTLYELIYHDPQAGVTISRAPARRWISGLGPGRSSRGSRLIRTTRSFPPGTYWMKICADGNRAIKETNERNNCRSSRKITIKQPPLPEY